MTTPPRPSSAQSALDQKLSLHGGGCGTYFDRPCNCLSAAARAELSGLRERIKALETALERYGRHDDSFVPRARCAVHKIVNGKYAPCDCGFDAALKGPQ